VIALLLLCLFIPLNVLPLHAALDTNEYLQSGMEHMKDGDYEKAAYAFEKALELQPDVAEIHNALGVAYLNSPEGVDKAQAEFEKAIALKPEYGEAYFNLGLSYSQHRQDLLSSKEYFEKTIQFQPGFAPAYHALGLVRLMGENKPEEAIELFKKAIAINPDMAEAQFALGLAYAMQGKAQEVLGPITALRALRNEPLAASLESIIRGDGMFLGRPVQQGDEPPPAENAPPPDNGRPDDFKKKLI
jgi:tetratricopeptide (TPR) repeat protein